MKSSRGRNSHHPGKRFAQQMKNMQPPIKLLARPARLERATYGFVVRRSIQLSYGRALNNKIPVFFPLVNWGAKLAHLHFGLQILGRLRGQGVHSGS